MERRQQSGYPVLLGISLALLILLLAPLQAQGAANDPAYWQTPTLQNSWTNVQGGSYEDVGYYKDDDGTVHLRGRIEGGSAGTTAFTLPAGYRPSERLALSTQGIFASISRVDIAANGDVIVVQDGTYPNLDNISFKAASATGNAVGAAGNPAFQSNWGNYGGGYQGITYYKDSKGLVHLQGLARKSTAWSCCAWSGGNGHIFTLPAGYRPDEHSIQQIVVGETNAPARLDIYSTGEVYLNPETAVGGSGGVWWASLSGVSFHAASSVSWNALAPDFSYGMYTEGAFRNSWTNYGGGHATASYYKNSRGRVFLKGLVTGGSLQNPCSYFCVSAEIFYLPAGYRPSRMKVFQGGWGKTVYVNSDGKVWSSTTGLQSLDGISFSIQDTAKPTITLEQKSGQADPTNTAPVQFTLSANESLDYSTISSADFTITNGTWSAISPASNSDSYTIDVTPSGQGAVQITTSASFSIADPNGNTVSSSDNVFSVAGSDRSVTYDTSSPTANWSAVPSSPNKNTSLQYTLSFTESVTGLAAEDLSNQGTATGCSFSVSGSGSSYTITVSSCSEGTLEPVLAANSVQDAAGNLAPLVAKVPASIVTLDRTAPALPTITSPYSDTNDSTPTWSWSGAEGGGSYECKIDSGAWASCASPYTASTLAEGTHTFSVRQTDAAGNVGLAAEDSFTVDLVSPSAPTLANSFTATSDNTPTWSWSGAEVGGTYECKIDSGSWASCSPSHTSGALADGEHTFSVRQVDAAGNISTAADDSFSVDTTAPAAPTLSNSFTTTNDNTPTWSWSGAEAGGTYQCKIDSGAWGACTSPYTASTLSEGAHTFSLRQVDDAGNAGSVEVDNITVDAFNVDTTSPTAAWSGTPSSPNNGSSLQYTLSFSESVTGLASGDLSNQGTATGCSFGISGSGDTYTVTISSCSGGTLQPRLAADSVQDEAGNTGPASAEDGGSILIDLTVPELTISSSPANPAISSKVTFSWDTAAGETYQCQLDSAPATSCTSPKTYNNIAEGAHTLTVTATNATGNTGQDTLSWTRGGNYAGGDTSASAEQQQQLSVEIDPAIEVVSPAALSDTVSPQSGGNAGASDDADFASTVDLRSNLSWISSATEAETFGIAAGAVTIIGAGDTGGSNGAEGAGDGTQSYNVDFNIDVSWADDAGSYDAAIDHDISNSL